MVKKIKAEIAVPNLDDITQALEATGINQMAVVSKCLQLDSRGDRPFFFRGKRRPEEVQPEIGLELVVEEALVGQVLEIINKTKRTAGDGEISVTIQAIEEALLLETTDGAGRPPKGVGT
jgi:nitrogen regulatory protein PII